MKAAMSKSSCCLVFARLLLCALLGCGAEGEVTEVLVELNAEESVASRLTSLRVEVYDIESPASSAQPRRVDAAEFPLVSSGRGQRLPFSFGVTKHRAERFLLVVIGYANQVLVIEHKVRIQFSAGHSRRAYVQLTEACYQRNCTMPDASDWFTRTCTSELAAACSDVTQGDTSSNEPGLGDAGVLVERDASGEQVTPTIGLDAAVGVGTDSSVSDRADGSVVMPTPPVDAAATATTEAGQTSPRDAGALVNGGPNYQADITGCYYLRMGNGKPILIDAGAIGAPDTTFDAPWGAAQVQALEIRPVIDKAMAIVDLTLYQLNTNSMVAAWRRPGMNPIVAPEGAGIFMPSGPMSLRMLSNYDNTRGTTDVSDSSGFQVCVTNKLRPRVLGLLDLYAVSAGIPANAQNHPVSSSCAAQVTAPVTLVSVMAATFRYATRATLAGPSGSILDVASPGQVPDYLALPNVAINQGDRLTLTCTYDNPTSSILSFVHFGDNENCHAFVYYYPHKALECF